MPWLCSRCAPLPKIPTVADISVDMVVGTRGRLQKIRIYMWDGLGWFSLLSLAWLGWRTVTETLLLGRLLIWYEGFLLVV